MTSSTLLSRGTLAAMFAAGCLLAPTAMADTAEGPWLRDSARANVYVPPAQAGPPRVPVRPEHTQPITVSADGASAWAVIGVALGCIALLASAGVVVMRRVRRAQRAVV